MSTALVPRVLLLLSLLATSCIAVAQETTGTDEPTSETAEPDDPVSRPFSPLKRERSRRKETDPETGETFEFVGPPDPCDWQLEGEEIQEQTQDVLRGMSCHTFRWFDHLFGKSEPYPEEQINGLVTVGAEYTEYDHLDARLRFRVRAPLPNMNRRWDVLLGRVDEDAYISDTEARDQTFYNPGIVNRNEEETWLLGLGHRRKGGRSGWDWDVGVRLRTPVVPYVRLQYYWYHSFTENLDLRFRQTFFWRDDDGWGTTSRGDLAHRLNATNVLRWEGVATDSDVTEGWEWYFGQTWYHLLGNRRAFSLRAFVRGETDAPVELQEYGFNFIWRRPFTRDWIYLSFGPSITWPRYFLEESRETSLGFGTWIEMEFGDWRY